MITHPKVYTKTVSFFAVVLLAVVPTRILRCRSGLGVPIAQEFPGSLARTEGRGEAVCQQALRSHPHGLSFISFMEFCILAYSILACLLSY